jgi:hypothetical protein
LRRIVLSLNAIPSRPRFGSVRLDRLIFMKLEGLIEKADATQMAEVAGENDIFYTLPIYRQEISGS